MFNLGAWLTSCETPRLSCLFHLLMFNSDEIARFLRWKSICILQSANLVICLLTSFHSTNCIVTHES